MDDGHAGVRHSYDGWVLLGSDDVLPVRPRRVLVAGTSGSGKTTFAERIADAFELPHVEIDALFHGPGWRPRESFLVDVDAFSARDRWVTEWQYSAARDLLPTERISSSGSTCPGLV